MSLRVLKPGLQTTIQDTGRHGYAALGVGTAGAMDDVALRLANALVGNACGAAALEMTMIGAELHIKRDSAIALTGAETELRLIAPDGRTTMLSMWRPLQLRAGSVLACGKMRRGARSYLAVAGGLAPTRLLGSAATDINARLGPFGGRALRAGDVLDIGPVQDDERNVVAQSDTEDPDGASPTWSLDPRPWYADSEQPLRVLRGSHFDALDHASQQRLFDAEFRISADSNRVGLRLDGPRLVLSEPIDLVTEPVATGTLQLPPDGQPIALMVEHPTTGGYPRIGQIAAIDLARLGQRRPGDALRFAPIALDDAQSRYLARERELARLIETIARRRAR